MNKFLLTSLITIILVISLFRGVIGVEEDVRPFCPLKTVIMTGEGPRALIVFGENAAQMDVEASELIADYIISFGGEVRILNASMVTQSDLEGNHLIVVGGPVANQLSRTINETSRFSMFLGEDGWYLRVNASPGGTWGGRFEAGIVGAMPNPWNENYTLIYVAGINRYATLASAKELVELGESKDYWAVVVLNRQGLPLPLRSYKIYRPPPPPPELSFLNVTKEGEVPSGVIRVWVITQNDTGWYIIRGAEEDEFPLNGTYNAFYLENNVNQSRALGLGDNVSIFLGIYLNGNSYPLEAPEPWTWAEVRYNSLYTNFTLFAGDGYLRKDELVPIPWTGERAYLQVEALEPDGRFELAVFEYLGGMLMGTDLVRLNLSVSRSGSFDISPGPDGSPTVIKFQIPSYSVTEEWVRLDLMIDYGPQPDHSLNLTDTGEVGDDVNPWNDVGLLIEAQGGKLWVVRTQRILVPFCEGLVKDSLVDVCVWADCKPYILDEEDWLVATIPIGD